MKPWQGQQTLHVQPAPISIEWQGLGCSYRSGGGTTVVLEGVWGKALPGQMQVRLPGFQLHSAQAGQAEASAAVTAGHSRLYLLQVGAELAVGGLINKP